MKNCHCPRTPRTHSTDDREQWSSFTRTNRHRQRTVCCWWWCWWQSITHARTLIYPRDLIFMRRSPSGHYISTNIPEPPIAVAAVVWCSVIFCWRMLNSSYVENLARSTAAIWGKWGRGSGDGWGGWGRGDGWGGWGYPLNSSSSSRYQSIGRWLCILFAKRSLYISLSMKRRASIVRQSGR